MGQQPDWQQLRATAGPRLRAAASAAQPIGVRVILSADAAARHGADRLPPRLQQRLGLKRAEASVRRRRRRRQRIAAAAASTLVAGLAAAETSRRSQELRQLGDELTQLREDAPGLGGRRARERARRRRRRQLITVGTGVGAATATAAALHARRLRRARPVAEAAEQPKPTEAAASDSDQPPGETRLSQSA